MPAPEGPIMAVICPDLNVPQRFFRTVLPERKYRVRYSARCNLSNTVNMVPRRTCKLKFKKREN